MANSDRSGSDLEPPTIPGFDFEVADEAHEQETLVEAEDKVTTLHAATPDTLLELSEPTLPRVPPPHLAMTRPYPRDFSPEAHAGQPREVSDADVTSRMAPVPRVPRPEGAPSTLRRGPPPPPSSRRGGPSRPSGQGSTWIGVGTPAAPPLPAALESNVEPIPLVQRPQSAPPEPARELPPMPPPFPEPAAAVRLDQPGLAPPHTYALGAYAPPTRAPPSAPPPVPTRQRAVWLPIAAAVTVLAALGCFALLIWMVVDRNTAEADADAPLAASSAPLPTAATTTSASAVSAPGESAPPIACRVSGQPVELADDVAPGASPMAAALSAPGQVAVGIPGARYAARGFVLDASSLSADKALDESYTRPVFRVTPLPGESPPRFEVDHDDPRLRTVRTVPLTTPIQIGVNYFGIVRLGTAEPTLVWEGGKNAEISEPRFAAAGDGRHALVFRRDAQIHLGWLTQAGERAGELSRVEVQATELGASDVAASTEQVLVTVSGRAASGQRRRLYAATAAVGAAPARLSVLGFPQGDTTSPSALSLSGGRWLLTWVDTASGVLMARLLDGQLEPQGATLALSGAETRVSSEHAALIQVGEQVLTFYAESRGRRTALMVRRLSCG